MQGRVLLIVDPCMVTPEIKFYNFCTQLVSEFSASGKSKITSVRFVLPKMTSMRVQDVIRETDVGAVISLGSYANLTDRHPWADNLAKDFHTEVVDQGIPLFGICFTHQLVGFYEGGHVDYLKNRRLIERGAYYAYRSTKVTHPKLRLLTARMSAKDYFSENKRDLDYRRCFWETKNWDSRRWHDFTTQNLSLHTAKERHVWNFLQEVAQDKFVTHARHEQEIRSLVKNSKWLLAGTSEACSIDALVHADFFAYTFQTHPETWHESEDGWNLIRNFVYLSSL